MWVVVIFPPPLHTGAGSNVIQTVLPDRLPSLSGVPGKCQKPPPQTRKFSLPAGKSRLRATGILARKQRPPVRWQNMPAQKQRIISKKRSMIVKKQNIVVKKQSIAS